MKNSDIKILQEYVKEVHIGAVRKKIVQVKCTDKECADVVTDIFINNFDKLSDYAYSYIQDNQVNRKEIYVIFDAKYKANHFKDRLNKVLSTEIDYSNPEGDDDSDPGGDDDGNSNNNNVLFIVAGVVVLMSVIFYIWSKKR